MEQLEFDVMTQDQIMNVEGGVGFAVGVGIGIVAGWVADGILDATTGKTGSEYVSDAISAGAKNVFNNFFSRSSGAGDISSSGYSHSGGTRAF
ncbi:hypothetical protein [Anaerocolumna sp.]|uniref:hypothetical protein n=1 Tax=Anaerocolumna sp. TaxID=2041569 RepID=UPI0028AE55CE|nr:hypothetical protein [Anaerocolumna sp.]